jgi:ABC-type multidrug transport system fused ATPase/permease subunit
VFGSFGGFSQLDLKHARARPSGITSAKGANHHDTSRIHIDASISCTFSSRSAMKSPAHPIVKRSLFSWVIAGNLKLQILLVVLIAITVFIRVIPLEMQKRIVNEAIGLRKMDLLIRYCLIYLAAVVFSSGLKFCISLIQTWISERVLASMRNALYEHIITLPLSFFRKSQPGMVVSALVTELATAGSYAGQAIATPLINVLTLLTFAGYLIRQNLLLAAISFSIYPIIVFLIPILQKRANQANKKRVDATRTMSSKIGETITGIHEIQGNGTFKVENRRFSRLVQQMYKIRLVWNVYKQAIKVGNNFFVNLGPFIIFLLGGYLAMNGKLELGAMVAFLSAQEKLYDPWKELIDFYQMYMDAIVSYKRTMEYFDTPIEFQIEDKSRQVYELSGAIEVKNLSFVSESGIQLLEDISLSLNPGESLALIGYSGSGKSILALCIGQLYTYTDGHILIDGHEVLEMTKNDMVNNMGFVSQAPFTFSGTIEENLLYSIEALKDIREDMQAPSRDDKIAVLHQTGLFLDVLQFGFNTVLSREKHADLAGELVRVRQKFQKEFGGALANYLEFFDENHYLYHSDIIENLFLGTPNNSDYSSSDLTQNKRFMNFLSEAELVRPLTSLGAELGKQTVDILGELEPDAVFFEQSPIMIDQWDDVRRIVDQLKRYRLNQLPKKDQDFLLNLALHFKPGKHKLAALPPILEKMILEGRFLFREHISRENPGAFSFYNASEYIFSQSILNNILFGQITTSNVKAIDTINQSIIQLIIEEDFLETLVEIGMQFEVGSKGDRLSGGQKQKLAIARTLLKQPKILIMDEATSALDNKSQTRIQNLIETRWKGRSTIIMVAHRLDIIQNYDKIAVMKAGKIIEMGSYQELIDRKGVFYELVGAKR